MKAEYYKLKCSLDSALHLQDFLNSTNMANSLMTDTECLYMQATQLCDQIEEKRCQLTRYRDTCMCSVLWSILFTRLELALAERGVLLSTDGLLSESKQAAVEVVLKKLQEKIELQYLLMQRRHGSIQKNTSTL